MSLFILLYTTSILIFSTIGLGNIILSKLKLKGVVLYTVLSFFTGEIILSFIWTIISILFKHPFNTITVAIFVVFGVFYFFLNNNPNLFKISPFKSKTEKLFGLLLTLIISFYLLNSLIEPFDWDVISYHLPVIKEISLGKIFFPLLQSSSYINFFSPFSFFFGSLPYSSEAYASIGYVFSNNASFPHLIYLVNFLFFLHFVGEFLKTFFKTDRLINFAVSILILLNHGLVLVLSTGLIDSNLMIYQLSAYLLAILTLKDPKYIYLYVAFASYAIGQKYTSLFILLPSAIYLFIGYIKNVKLQSEVGGIIQFIAKSFLIFFISGGIWYFKNLLLHGNPVYPLYLGHRGMSEEVYKLLMDNLIYELRLGHSFSDLLNLLKINYLHEIGVLLSLTALIVFYLLRIIRLNRISLFLIASASWIYLINFYLGSQLSRFVLIVPVILYLLLSQVFIKNRFITILIILITVLGTRLNPLQWSTWSSRIQNVILFVTFREDELLRKNIGCVFDTYNYLKMINSSALNFWDPYAPNYYSSDSLYVNIPQDNSFNKIKDKNIDYLYINYQYRQSFIDTKEVHRDIDIDGRLKLENELIGSEKAEFVRGNCHLYRINKK